MGVVDNVDRALLLRLSVALDSRLLVIAIAGCSDTAASQPQSCVQFLVLVLATIYCFRLTSKNTTIQKLADVAVLLAKKLLKLRNDNQSPSSLLATVAASASISSTVNAIVGINCVD